MKSECPEASPELRLCGDREAEPPALEAAPRCCEPQILERSLFALASDDRLGAAVAAGLEQPPRRSAPTLEQPAAATALPVVRVRWRFTRHLIVLIPLAIALV